MFESMRRDKNGKDINDYGRCFEYISPEEPDEANTQVVPYAGSGSPRSSFGRARYVETIEIGQAAFPVLIQMGIVALEGLHNPWHAVEPVKVTYDPISTAIAEKAGKVTLVASSSASEKVRTTTKHQRLYYPGNVPESFVKERKQVPHVQSCAF